MLTCFPFTFENFQADENREAVPENVPLHQQTEEGISARFMLEFTQKETENTMTALVLQVFSQAT